MQSIKIGIDICNTIADVNKCIRQALNLPDACFREYGLSRYGIDEEEWFVRHLEVFAEARPLPGAVEALDMLASSGAEICYVTARPEQAKAVTLGWLKKWYFPSGQLIMTQAKDEAVEKLSLDLVLEDAPPEIEKLKKAGVDIVVYRQPYNNGLFDWKHCRELLCSKNLKITYLPTGYLSPANISERRKTGDGRLHHLQKLPVQHVR